MKYKNNEVTTISYDEVEELSNLIGESIYISGSRKTPQQL